MKIPGYVRICAFLLAALVVIFLGNTGKANAAGPTPLNQKNLDKISKIRCDESRPLRFVVLGDSRSNPSKFKEIIDLANSLKPDFVIHTGDVVENGDKPEYDKLRPLFNRFNEPFLVIPGNHEINKVTKNLQNYISFFGKTGMLFDLCGVRFILLDNSKGYLTDEQLIRLKTDLKTDNVRMIFMHAPPATIWPEHTFKRNAKGLVDLIKQSGCEYAFFSHVHGYDHRMIGDKCNGYISGGAGAELSGYGFAQEKYHVLLVTVDGKKVNVKMVPLKEKPESTGKIK